ncbi:hypothetical protein [Caenispirillum bisanense]|uniref:hypothetical protein n=1 Tax=Caenispirillum bisanense TaxID=414052 RepID=UPI00114167EC|nr:hypothetical protein [Caenispirillum bisanense]
MQMILRGAENSEIGRRFSVSESGAKTYVWGLYQHLGLTQTHGHNKRANVIALLKSLIGGMSDEDYLRIASIPKDWVRRYDQIGQDWQHVFDKSRRVNRRPVYGPSGNDLGLSVFSQNKRGGPEGPPQLHPLGRED